MQIRHLIADDDLAAAYPVLVELRPHLAELGAAGFVDLVRRMAADGYRLAAGFEDDNAHGGRPAVVAGFRVSETLSRGPHLFVDDLVTAELVRGRGAGREMVAWLRSYAVAQGLPRVCLDSRATARGFYERVGFAFSTSIPCCIEAGGPAPAGRPGGG